MYEVLILLLPAWLISALGFTAGAAWLHFAFMLGKQKTHLVIDRTDMIAVASTFLFVGIYYLLINIDRDYIRTVAMSRLAWFLIFGGGLLLLIKYWIKIHKDGDA